VYVSVLTRSPRVRNWSMDLINHTQYDAAKLPNLSLVAGPPIRQDELCKVGGIPARCISHFIFHIAHRPHHTSKVSKYIGEGAKRYSL
jgi:hypothetical protein